MLDAGRPPVTPTEPRERVGARFVLLLSCASLALWMSFAAVTQLLLPGQVERFAPVTKETTLGLVLTLGSLASVVATPLFGAASDRTGGRFGRRRPYLLAGAVLAGLALVGAGLAGSVAALVTAWVLCQLGLAAIVAVLYAYIPDQVPVGQRGSLSAYVGLTQVLGPVAGTGLVNVAGDGFVAKYAVLAVAVVLTAVLLATGVPELAAPAPARPPLRARAFLAGFWISPRRHPDFAWAWGTRFLVNLGYALTVSYLLYFLRDEVRYESLYPGRRSEDGVFLLNATAGAALLVTILLGGFLSDRLGRRKIFVIVSGLLIACGPAVLAVNPSWTSALVAAAFLGGGFGIFLAVDIALITEVLPAAGDRGKDMGIINIANALPPTIGPVLCGLIVTYGSYRALFAVAAAVTVAGAVLVRRIVAVR